MCAIVGWVADRGHFDLPKALASVRHRGPDAQGEHVTESNGLQIGLGHARLSIIDLSADANQPFVLAGTRHLMVYNGEVYNFAVLRAELERAGRSFRTHSDTEVVLQGLAHEGEGFLARLDGMFALAWLDLDAQRLLLCRDRLGIKPLYFERMGEGFGIAFASEMRALRALTGRRHAPDHACLGEFLLNGFLYEPATGVLGVQKVPPGHVVDVRFATREIRTVAFVGPATAPSQSVGEATRESASSARAARATALDHALREAVRSQRVADVPLGLFFSGGIDSSVLAAASTGSLSGLYLADEPRDGMPAGGDGAYVDAMATALDLPLRKVSLSSEGAAGEALLDVFRSVAAGVEEPVSDFTFVASATIAKAAKEAGYTVMLSGMGGDELFGGYPRYHLAARSALIDAMLPLAKAGTSVLRRARPMDKRWGRLASFLDADSFGMRYTQLIGYFAPAAVNELLGESDSVDAFRQRLERKLEPVRGATPLRQAMHLDRSGFLSHNLTVTDKSSMQHSIEVRVPLLSNEMLAFSESLSDAELVRFGRAKLQLSQWLSARVPRELVERKKAGFNPRLDERIKQLGRDLLESVLTGPTLRAILDPTVCARYVAEHFEGRENHTYRLWQLVFLALWLERFEH